MIGDEILKICGICFAIEIERILILILLDWYGSSEQIRRYIEVF